MRIINILKLVYNIKIFFGLYKNCYEYLNDLLSFYKITNIPDFGL